MVFMKWNWISIIIILFTLIFLQPLFPVSASSDQSYQDYIVQFDKYRSVNNDFKIAKNEYDKFNTLNSQTTVLEKVKVMLTARDTLLKSYLLFLSEKLNENSGLSDSNKELYQKLINNEINFLDNHNGLIPSIGSISDASTVSKQLSSHYIILQTSIRQTILGLSYGQLMDLYKKYSDSLNIISSILNESRLIIPVTKQSTADRWVVSINSKKTLYEQKMDRIDNMISGLSSGQLDELDRKMGDIQKELGEARTYLQDGTSYIKELMEILRYRD
jgi:hypothetical protein